MTEAERPKSNALYGQKLFASEQKDLQLFQTLDRSKEEVAQLLARCMNCGIVLSPHSMREMKDIYPKTRSAFKWKNISLDLLPQVVEEWALMTPLSLNEWGRVRLLQRVDRLLVHLSSSKMNACPGGGARTISERYHFQEKGS